MTNEEYQELRDLPAAWVKGSLLTNQRDRTLLYGYTLERHTHHVYLWKGSICLFVYTLSNERIRFRCSDSYRPAELIPSKRLYPERCDYEFCKLLQHRGVFLPYTSFDPNGVLPEGRRYAGQIL